MSVAVAMIQKLQNEVFKALMEQSQFALDYEHQLVLMKTHLDLIKAYLADRDNLSMKTESLKKFMLQLKALLYEADDVVTDCKIRDEYVKDWSCFLPNEAFLKYVMKKKMRKINCRMEMIERNLDCFLIPQGLSVQGDAIYQIKRYTAQHFEQSEIIGIEADLKKLKSWIFSKSDVLNRVGIVGMGGLGKTTIAEKFFHDRDVAVHFEHRIWVSVTKDFSEYRIMKSMLEQLGLHYSGSDLHNMLNVLNNLLQRKSCLLVLDDVWGIDFHWWSNLCTSLQRNAGEISFIIITRNEDAAALMGVESFRIHRPKCLNDDESWCLFCKFAFVGSKRICHDPRFRRVGMQIVSQCGGLPIAIKTIAALLATNSNNLVEWNKVEEDFHELSYRDNFGSIMASLKLSYNALPMHLKQLIVCFSIYPEYFEIQADQLVHWWAGEDLVPETGGSLTASEVCYNSLADLANRCLVEVVHRHGYDGRVYSCKLHDLVREFILVIAEDEAICSFDERGRQILTPYSCWLGFRAEMSIKSLKHCSKLRAFFMMSENELIFHDNLGPLTSLRVLDLSLIKLDDTSVENLMKWIVSLKRLAYLNLSGASGLKVVPSSIQTLRNLQYIVLAGCRNLVKVHPSLTYLKKLVVLDLGSCGLQYLPRGIGMLSQLQELSGFKVARQSNTQSCHLLELRELVQLRVLRISLSNESEIFENELYVLERLWKLKVLVIDAEDCTDKNVLAMVDRLSPPPDLRELYLRHYYHEIPPQWINPEKLSHLQYLCVEEGDLIHLAINPNEEIRFWNLEGLCMKFLPKLTEDWENLKTEMPFLHYVEVSHCFHLRNFPCPVDGHGFWMKSDDDDCDD